MRLLRRIAIVVLAIMTLATALLPTHASADEPYATVNVTSSGNLEIVVLEGPTVLQLHQNGPNGFAVWVHELVPLLDGPGALLEIHNVSNVTGNVNIEVVASHVWLLLASESGTLEIPGSLVIRRTMPDAAGLDKIEDAIVGGDIRYSSVTASELRTRGVTVGDDVVIAGTTAFFAIIDDTDIADRLRITVDPRGFLNILVQDVNAGNTLVVGGENGQRGDDVEVKESTFGTARFRMRAGSDELVIHDSSFAGRLLPRGHDGDDFLELVDVSAQLLNATAGDGDDVVNTGTMTVLDAARSKLSGGRGQDQWFPTAPVGLIDIRQFEEITPV